MTSGWIVLVGVLGGGVAYLTGVAMVMLTYRWPVRRYVADAQRARLDQLRGLHATLPSDAIRAVMFGSGWPAKDATPIALLETGRSVLGALKSQDSAPHIGLALSAARNAASAGVLSEYEYRRYLRQLTAGSLPGITIAAIAAILTDTTVYGLADGWAWVLRAAIFAAAVATLRVMLIAVQYQELVSQGLLLDTAFLQALQPRQTPGK
jgi:hypothetical protein